MSSAVGCSVLEGGGVPTSWKKEPEVIKGTLFEQSSGGTGKVAVAEYKELMYDKKVRGICITRLPYYLTGIYVYKISPDPCIAQRKHLYEDAARAIYDYLKSGRIPGTVNFNSGEIPYSATLEQ